MTSIVEKLRKFILENYLFTDDDNALGNSDSFLDKGIIDSTGILEVIMFVESGFGISVLDEEMLPENFDSIDNLARYVSAKVG